MKGVLYLLRGICGIRSVLEACVIVRKSFLRDMCDCKEEVFLEALVMKGVCYLLRCTCGIRSVLEACVIVRKSFLS